MATKSWTDEEQGVITSGIIMVLGLLAATIAIFLLAVRTDNSVVAEFVSIRPHYKELKFKALWCMLFVAWGCFAYSQLYFRFDYLKKSSKRVEATMTFVNFLRLMTAATVLMMTTAVSFLMPFVFFMLS
ncbi:hypothetical protein [Ensifer adhaerens]|uniref:hypothetical protein n=1 Tax=Ensifer adhaerens TaxID=106592 RepID=UPI000CF1076B|nr:hypothetical protein [Ensifer adhaerens]